MSLYKTGLNRILPASISNHCIILDLDETCLETLLPTEENPNTLAYFKELGVFTNPKLIDLRRRTYSLIMDDVCDKKGTGTKLEMIGIARPHIQEFLIFCFSYFKVVAVWSAGKRRYVESIVDFLFKDIRRPHVIFTRDDLDKDLNNDFTKPIQKMINNVPGLNKFMSLNNTFILDDRKTVFEHVNPDNGILIPAYKPPFTIRALRTDDLALPQLMNWLMKPEVINSDDVRLLDKNNIFI